MHTGFIEKLIVENFQSYASATFNFASFNYIAAPNGSGKSTIASAICLLCLGSPRHLGKECDIGSFVKFGCQSGYIEGHFKLDKTLLDCNLHSFTIRDRQFDNICILKREITVNNGSYFYINNKRAKVRDVSALMKSFGIDVTSMTQFLAQERVSSFARLKPEELFKEVISMVGEDLSKPLACLKEIEEKIFCIDKDLKQTQNEVEGTEKIVSQLESNVKNLEEVMQKQNCIELCKLKMCYLDYINIRKEIEQKDQENKNILSSILEHREGIKFAKNELDMLDKSNDVVDMRNKLREFDDSNNTLSVLYREYHNAKLNGDLLTVDLKSIKKKKEEQIKEELETKEHIEELKSKYERLKIEPDTAIEKDILKMLKNVLLSKITDTCDDAKDMSLESILKYDSELKKCQNLDFKKQNISEILKSIIHCKNESKLGLAHEERQMQKQCTNMHEESENCQRKKLGYLAVEQKRLEILKKYSNDAYNALLWLRKNKNIFKGEILEPALIHIRLKNKKYLIEVENSLTNNMLFTFVCMDEEDFTLLANKLKDELGYKINILVYSPISISSKNSIKSTYNVDGFIIDYIDARKEYLEMFCTLGQLHNIPVSKGKIDEKIFDLGFIKIISNGRYVERKTSRYDKNDMIVIDSDLKGRNILNDEGNTKEIYELDQKIIEIGKKREQLFEEMKILLSNKQRIEGDLELIYNVSNEYEKKILVIYEAQRNKNKLELRIKDLSNLLPELSNFAYIESKIAKLNVLIQENVSIQTEWYSKLKKNILDTKFFSLYENLFDLEEKLQKSISEKHRLQNDIKSLNAIIEEHDKNSNQITMDIKQLKHTRDQYKDKVKKQRRIVEDRKYHFYIEKENGDINNEKTNVNIELERLPNDLETLKHQIINLTTEISATHYDEEALKEYKKKNNTLELTRDEMNNIKNTLIEHKKEESNLRMRLIENIHSLIAPLNTKFEFLFKKLDTEGQIEFEHNNLDSSKWKINILVKFRKQESLQVLAAHRQSGGEKSVSTILFLIALQELSKSPFKLLDEINQGMDRTNEGIINDILAEISETTGTQFFVITPKIVKDITIGKKMKVFVIYKGLSGDMDKYKKSLINNP